MLWIYQPRAELPPRCLLSGLSRATGIGLVQRLRIMRWGEWFGIINNKERRQHRGDKQLRRHPRNGMVGLFGSLAELSAKSHDGELPSCTKCTNRPLCNVFGGRVWIMIRRASNCGEKIHALTGIRSAAAYVRPQDFSSPNENEAVGGHGKPRS
jgi:hypothetical protein